MDRHKRIILIGVWASLALALLLAPSGRVEAIPPPPPGWGGEEEHAVNRDPALKYPLLEDALPGSGFSLPDAAPSGVYPPGDAGQGKNTALAPNGLTCAIDTSFDTALPADWNQIAGTWYTENSNLFTTGVPDKLASIVLPGRYINLSYEARMQRAGCDNCETSLIIRGKPYPLNPNTNFWNDSYTFGYTRDGHYHFSRIINNVGMSIEYGTSPAINQGAGWNTLRVEAINTHLSFYINNVLIWSGIDYTHFSGQAGIAMWDSSSTSGDRLWVDYVHLCLLGNLSYLPGVLQP